MLVLQMTLLGHHKIPDMGARDHLLSHAHLIHGLGGHMGSAVSPGVWRGARNIHPSSTPSLQLVFWALCFLCKIVHQES